jgi:hypothetical protein
MLEIIIPNNHFISKWSSTSRASIYLSLKLSDLVQKVLSVDENIQTKSLFNQKVFLQLKGGNCFAREPCCSNQRPYCTASPGWNVRSSI